MTVTPKPGAESFTQGKIYYVIGIEADDYRVIADDGKPYLTGHTLFDVVDATEPADWISEKGEDGERYAYPVALLGAGFFEDFFEGEPEAVAAFWQEVNRRMGRP